MITFELRGDRGSYWMVRRAWDGISQVTNSRLAKLTNDEADSLVQCDYFNKALSGHAHSDLDPMTLLTIIEKGNDRLATRLMVTLPLNYDLNRYACNFVDPFFMPDSNDWRASSGWYDKFTSRNIAQTWKFTSSRKNNQSPIDSRVIIT